jgi:hypothetical protein
MAGFKHNPRQTRRSRKLYRMAPDRRGIHIDQLAWRQGLDQ